MLQSLMLQNYLISGQKGPYSTYTDAGRAANAGNEVAGLLKTNSFWKLNNSDIKYSNMNGAYDNGNQYFRAPGPELSVKSSLAFSTEALTGYDCNKDGVVSTAEFNAKLSRDKDTSFKYAHTIDLNNDGKIDSGEYSAWMIYQDGIRESATGIKGYDKNKVNGKVSSNESKLAKEAISDDPNTVKSVLQQIYKDNNIEDAQNDFEMPPKSWEQPSCPGGQDFMQMIMMFFQMMFGGFHGPKKCCKAETSAEPA